MKKIFAILLFTANSLACHAQFGGFNSPYSTTTQKFIAPTVNEQTKLHKKVAIFPFSVSIEYKTVPEGLSDDSILKEAIFDGKWFQRELNRDIKERREKHPYTADFLLFDLLKRPDLQKDFIKSILPDTEIVSTCKDLQVDAIVLGKVIIVPNESWRRSFHLLGEKGVGGRATAYIKIYDGKDGSLLWYYKAEVYAITDFDWLGYLPDALEKIAKKFPYQGK